MVNCGLENAEQNTDEFILRLMNSQLQYQEGTNKLIIATTGRVGYIYIYEQIGVEILRSRQYEICSQYITGLMTISEKCHSKGSATATYTRFNMPNI